MDLIKQVEQVTKLVFAERQDHGTIVVRIPKNVIIDLADVSLQKTAKAATRDYGHGRDRTFCDR